MSKSDEVPADLTPTWIEVATIDALVSVISGSGG